MTQSLNSLPSTLYDVLIDAQEKAAEFLVGGLGSLSPISLRPTIVTNIPRYARIRDEETSGPSVSVYQAEDDDTAIEIANDSAYDLSAAGIAVAGSMRTKLQGSLSMGKCISTT